MGEETQRRVERLSAGAAAGAPTAPHATPAGDGAPATGPARFWAARRLRWVFRAALAASLAAHYGLAPWTLLPDRSGIELKEVDEELSIPVELLGEQSEPEAPPPPAAVMPAPEDDPNAPGRNKRDAGPPKSEPRDAGAPKPDGGDAGEERDGGDAPLLADHGDAGLESGEGDGGVFSAGAADASTPGGPDPRDPGSMVGMSGLVTAGKVNVTMLVNVAAIRNHPAGTRMGPLVWGIPKWNDFIDGAQGHVDPMRDVDWILIYGPSLIQTDRDAVLVRYSAPDEAVDRAVAAIAKRYEKGGAFDVGVPGVKATLGWADSGKRVFLRPQPHLLVVVPPDKAKDFANVFRKASAQPRVRPGEAFRLTVRDPWKQVAVPGLKFPQTLTEIRVWVVPRRLDGGADVYAEGDSSDPAAAQETADLLTEVIRRQNSSMLVRIATRGLFNGARVEVDGTLLKLHVSASSEQLESVLQLAASQLGVRVEPSPIRR